MTSVEIGRIITHGLWRRIFPCSAAHIKQKQSSTTCGEELQTFSKIGKVQNSNLTRSTHHNLGVPEIFDFMKFYV